jgi:beta-glucosidase
MMTPPPFQECLAGFDGGAIFLAPPVNNTPSSAFPQPVNMGNSWDKDLVREIASAISDEARAAFNHAARPSLTCMSPNLNVNRDPRWGRNIESFGEDPSLIAAMGKSYIRGIQVGRAGIDDKAAESGILKIMAVPKHLGAYSLECFNPSGGDNTYPHCKSNRNVLGKAAILTASLAAGPIYRSNYNAVVDATDLRETYFPGWQAAVQQADAQGVMCS